MSLPKGFRYYNNLAIYPIKGLTYTKDYGEDLESRYDRADKNSYEERIFCLDCLIFEACKGRSWKGCPYRSMALKIIRGE